MAPDTHAFISIQWLPDNVIGFSGRAETQAQVQFMITILKEIISFLPSNDEAIDEP